MRFFVLLLKNISKKSSIAPSKQRGTKKLNQTTLKEILNIRSVFRYQTQSMIKISHKLEFRNEISHFTWLSGEERNDFTCIFGQIFHI